MLQVALLVLNGSAKATPARLPPAKLRLHDNQTVWVAGYR